MPQLVNHEAAVEFKLLHRNGRDDLNVLLLYTLALLIKEKNYKSGKYMLGPGGERRFIDNCFFCGCLPDKTGKAVSYFVLQNISLFVLFQKIKEQYPLDGKIYQAAVIEYLLENLLGTLKKENDRPYEKVLIYDTLREDIAILDHDKIYELKEFCLSGNKKKKVLARIGDNLAAICKTLLNWHGKKDIKIYLTLSDDNKPDVAGEFESYFEFCTKSDRKNRAICRTKTYIKDNIISKEKKYKPVYDFVELSFPK